MYYKNRNQGIEFEPHVLHIGSEFTAGSVTYDAVAVTTKSVDRVGFGSAKIVIGAKTTTTTGKALHLALSIQDSADDNTFNTAVALVSENIVSGLTTSDYTTFGYNIDLSGYERYIKIVYTPDLTHTSTDTAVVTSAVILCGSDHLPL